MEKIAKPSLARMAELRFSACQGVASAVKAWGTGNSAATSQCGKERKTNHALSCHPYLGSSRSRMTAR